MSNTIIHTFENGNLIIKHIKNDEKFIITFRFNCLINDIEYQKYELHANKEIILNLNYLFKLDFSILFIIINNKPDINITNNKVNLKYKINILNKEYFIEIVLPKVELTSEEEKIYTKKSINNLKKEQLENKIKENNEFSIVIQSLYYPDEKSAIESLLSSRYHSICKHWMEIDGKNNRRNSKYKKPMKLIIEQDNIIKLIFLFTEIHRIHNAKITSINKIEGRYIINIKKTFLKYKYISANEYFKNHTNKHNIIYVGKYIDIISFPIEERRKNNRLISIIQKQIL